MGFYAVWCPACLATRFAALEAEQQALAVLGVQLRELGRDH